MFCQSLGGCFVSCCFSFLLCSPFSNNFVVMSLGSWPGLREEFRGGDHTAL